MMRRICMALAMAASFFGSGRCQTSEAPARTGDADTALIRFQVYMIRGAISGAVDRVEFKEKDASTSVPMTGASIVFDTSKDLRLADRQLVIDAKGWQWDGTPFSIEDHEFPKVESKVNGSWFPFFRKAKDSDVGDGRPGVTMITCPTILSRLGQTAELKIGSEVPIESFVPDADGKFERKIRFESTGLQIRAKLDKQKLKAGFADVNGDGRTDIAVAEAPAGGGAPKYGDPGFLIDLTISNSIIASRLPVAGTKLNVGEPIIVTHESKLEIPFQSGKEYGILMPTEDGQGGMLARMRIDSPPPPNGTPAK